MEEIHSYSMCVPVRDTDEEYAFLGLSLPAAMQLNPSEIVMSLDAPASARIRSRTYDIAKNCNYPSEQIKFVEVERSPDWNMRLAKVDYEMITAATHNRIFYFNVDVVLDGNIMLALNDIGADSVACISFTKRLLRRTISDRIRFYYYSREIVKEPMPFAGIYWLYKPYYLELINLEKYKKIYNGVDNFFTEAILNSGKYKLICRKEFGCDSLTYESNDYPWRQFQTGMWYGADFRSRIGGKNSLGSLKKIASVAFKRQHQYLLRGYIFAWRHPEDLGVRLAKSMSLVDWSLLGSKYIPMKEMKGTGTMKEALS